MIIFYHFWKQNELYLPDPTGSRPVLLAAVLGRLFWTGTVLPMSREEMDQLGWDSCDIILVTGDAYVDHPSFGMAICGRMLEAQGFRVGIIAQPDWSSKDDFMRLGKPNLFSVLLLATWIR